MATRAEGLTRLAAFLPRAGADYAARRNLDPGPDEPAHVSRLSPWLRHRLVTEQEVAAAALDRHGMARAEKFVQEVCWRSYWKGWLQQRPQVWREYCAARDRALAQLDHDAGQADAYRRATRGTTGIDGFDAWAQELVHRGYLHNHARMSFASIWIFTLGLPWALGADFFHRHLLDGDAASNTLSWRWVAGMQTPGKHYLASAGAIRHCSEARFDPAGQLRETAEPLSAPAHPPVTPLPEADRAEPAVPGALLLTDEDLHPESWPLPPDVPIVCALLLDGSALRSPLETALGARAFSAAALEDAAERVRTRWGIPCLSVRPETLHRTATGAGCAQILGAEPAVGPLRDVLEAADQAGAADALPRIGLRRAWDAAFWPQATRGFFALKKGIPETLRALGLPG